MNDSPVSTLEQKKDRRGLLALIGAGGAAAVTALLTRSNGAQAHGDVEGDSATSAPGVHGDNSGIGDGVYGTSLTGDAVHGWSHAGGYGVHGESVSGIGVYGKGGNAGVRGRGWGSESPGVEGISSGGRGVFGEGTTVPADPYFGTPTKYGTGVRGEGKWGVVGKATAAKGAGVIGKTGSGTTGVLASATGTKAALQVAGRARFKQAGKTAIAANTQAVEVTLAYTLAAGSLVMATLQGYAGAGIAVRYAKTVGTNKIRICLSKNASQAVDVAYFIFTP